MKLVLVMTKVILTVSIWISCSFSSTSIQKLLIILSPKNYIIVQLIEVTLYLFFFFPFYPLIIKRAKIKFFNTTNENEDSNLWLLKQRFVSIITIHRPSHRAIRGRYHSYDQDWSQSPLNYQNQIELWGTLKNNLVFYKEVHGWALLLGNGRKFLFWYLAVYGPWTFFLTKRHSIRRSEFRSHQCVDVRANYILWFCFNNKCFLVSNFIKKFRVYFFGFIFGFTHLNRF